MDNLSCYYCKLAILPDEHRRLIMFRDGSGKKPDIDGYYHADMARCFTRLMIAHEELKAQNKRNAEEVAKAIKWIEQEIADGNSYLNDWPDSPPELEQQENRKQVLRLLESLK